MKQFPEIYKRDSKGQVRVWRMELDGSAYRTVAGLQDGKLVTSEWTECKPKNVGRSNATTAEEQAESEVNSHYKKKLEGEYHEKVEDIDKPKWFKPMLAQPWEKRQSKIKYPCAFQPKLDGIRCIANSEGLWSRTGKPIVACPHVMEVLNPLFVENPALVLDGELYNHDLKHDFNEIVSMVRKAKAKPEDIDKSARMVQYHVYDMPMADETPFHDRFADMVALFNNAEVPHTNNGHVHGSDYGHIVHVVPTSFCDNEAQLDNHYAGAIGAGYEGGIVRLLGRYEQKRSNNLVKRKDFQDEEFEITGIEEGQGNWAGYAKVVHCRGYDGIKFKATLKGSQEYCREVLEEADQYIGKQVTVQFFERTPDGIPRFPIAKVVYKDKRW